MKTQLLVIGGGPGGYAAAFRAADLGLEVTIVESRKQLGGVCLNEGCIPSKTYLNVVQIIEEVERISKLGVDFKRVNTDLKKMSREKNNIVNKMALGLKGLANRRKVKIVEGLARFTSPYSVDVAGKEITFDKAIVAVGSRPIILPGWPEHNRIWDSTKALDMPCIPKKLIIAGAGIIGLEMACIYSGLGADVTLVELYEDLIPSCDRESVNILFTSLISKRCKFLMGTEIKKVIVHDKFIELMTSKGQTLSADYVISAVGRCGNADKLDIDQAGVEQKNGIIKADLQGRTSQSHIFAVGDVVGMPMLAHKATYQGKIAAEVIAGFNTQMNTNLIPSVAYTIPELAWIGYNLEQAKLAGYNAKSASFPWQASGRNNACIGDNGLTKLVYCEDTQRILGASLVGSHAGELLSEITLAIEMGANLKDLALTIHPHPTLSESLGFAAEKALGTLTDL